MPRNSVEHAYIDALELAGPPPHDQWRLTREHRHHLAVEAHRYTDNPGAFAPGLDGYLPFDHTPERPGPGQQRPLLVAHLAAEQVH